MGSTQSPAKNGIVYRDKERKLLTETDPTKDAWTLWGLNRLRSSGIPLHRLAMMCRIADDDIALSSVLCPACVEKMGAQVYPEPLRHSSDPAGTEIQVVDVVIELTGPIFKITRLNKNSNFCTTGVIPQARTRFLPPLGPSLVCRNTRVGWLAGALALDRQRNPLQAHCRGQGLMTCLELLYLGHSAAHLETALRSIQHSDLKSISRYLALVMRWLRRRNIPRDDYFRVVFQFMLPWIHGHMCKGVIPRAVV